MCFKFSFIRACIITLITFKRSFHCMNLHYMILPVMFVICTIVTEITFPLFFRVSVVFMWLQILWTMRGILAFVAIVFFAIMFSHMRFKNVLRHTFMSAYVTFEFRFFVIFLRLVQDLKSTSRKWLSVSSQMRILKWSRKKLLSGEPLACVFLIHNYCVLGNRNVRIWIFFPVYETFWYGFRIQSTFRSLWQRGYGLDMVHRAYGPWHKGYG